MTCPYFGGAPVSTGSFPSLVSPDQQHAIFTAGIPLTFWSLPVNGTAPPSQLLTVDVNANVRSVIFRPCAECSQKLDSTLLFLVSHYGGLNPIEEVWENNLSGSSLRRIIDPFNGTITIEKTWHDVILFSVNWYHQSGNDYYGTKGWFVASWEAGTPVTSLFANMYDNSPQYLRSFGTCGDNGRYIAFVSRSIDSTLWLFDLQTFQFLTSLPAKVGNFCDIRVWSPATVSPAQVYLSCSDSSNLKGVSTFAPLIPNLLIPNGRNCNLVLSPSGTASFGKFLVVSCSSGQGNLLYSYNMAFGVSAVIDSNLVGSGWPSFVAGAPGLSQSDDSTRVSYIKQVIVERVICANLTVPEVNGTNVNQTVLPLTNSSFCSSFSVPVYEVFVSSLAGGDAAMVLQSESSPYIVSSADQLCESQAAAPCALTAPASCGSSAPCFSCSSPPRCSDFFFVVTNGGIFRGRGSLPSAPLFRLHLGPAFLVSAVVRSSFDVPFVAFTAQTSATAYGFFVRKADEENLNTTAIVDGFVSSNMETHLSPDRTTFYVRGDRIPAPTSNDTMPGSVPSLFLVKSDGSLVSDNLWPNDVPSSNSYIYNPLFTPGSTYFVFSVLFIIFPIILGARERFPLLYPLFPS